MSVDLERHIVSALPESIVRRWRTLNTDNLLQDGGILAAATIVSGGLNYAFQLLMGRALGPAEFGAFGALFALFYLLSVVGRGIRFSASHFAADVASSVGARTLHRGMFVRAALIGCGVFVLLTIASTSIGGLLHVEAPIVVLVAAMVPISLALAAGQGTLEGHQYFVPLGSYQILHAALKLGFGGVLVVAGFGLYGAFGGIIMAMLVTLLALIYHVRLLVSDPTGVTESFAFDRAYRYGGPAVLAGFCLAVPTNADVILVKHFFPATEAGLYAATAVLGKVLVFLPMGISIALFPKVSAGRGGSPAASMNILLNRAMLAAAALGGTGALLYWFLPELILELFFGAPYTAAGPLLQWYGLAMVAFVLAVVILNFELARNRLAFVYLFAAVSIVEIGLIGLLHTSMLQIIQIILILNTTLLVWGVIRIKFDP